MEFRKDPRVMFLILLTKEATLMRFRLESPLRYLACTVSCFLAFCLARVCMLQILFRDSFFFCQATASEHRDFPEIKLRTSVVVPPIPMELFRSHGVSCLLLIVAVVNSCGFKVALLLRLIS